MITLLDVEMETEIDYQLEYLEKRMVQLFPYISLDIETTGLSLENSQILQITAIYDHGLFAISPEELPYYNVYIGDSIHYAEIGALELHEKAGFFTKLVQAKKAKTAVTVREALDGLLDFIDTHRGSYEDGKKRRISLAGKNIASFDLQILRNHMDSEQRRHFDGMIYSSFLDAGPLYLPDFGYVPSLSSILQLIEAKKEAASPAILFCSWYQSEQTPPSIDVIMAKAKELRTEVTHDAYDDALDVIKAIRYKMR